MDICFFSTGTWDPKKEKDIDVEQIENVFKVNFFGTLNSIKAVEKYFKDRKSGTITIVSSIAGYRGLPNSTCLLYTSPSPRDVEESRMPSSA